MNAASEASHIACNTKTLMRSKMFSEAIKAW